MRRCGWLERFANFLKSKSVFRKSSFWRLLRYLKPYWKFVLGAILMAFIGASFSVVLPWLVKDIIDRVLLERNIRLLMIISFGVIVIFFVKGVASYVQNYWISIAGFRTITRLRSELYAHLHNLSASFFHENPTGEVLSRMTNDISILQNFFANVFLNIFMDILIFLGSLVFLFFIHWKLALFSVAVFPLVGVCIDYLGKRIRGASHLLQKKTATLTSLIERAVTGMKIIQSYVSSPYEVQRFETENEINFRLAMKQARAKALLTPLVELIASCALTAVVWFGGREVIRGNLTPGGLVAFLGYLVTAASPLSSFSRGFQILQQSLASAERIFEFLDTPPQIKDEEGNIDKKEVTQGLNIKNVSFSYRGEKVLRDFSLEVKIGEKVGIVGPSGAGKSTLINLLLRFYDPDSGSIEIDGIDIRRIRLSSLRNLIGVVLQDALVLGGTIWENILYGKLNARPAEIFEAARKARAHDFVMTLEKGYDTNVGDAGCRLSGGQKQRIAIARAFLKNPPILVFDEATSNLDPESERYIREAIAEIERDKIVIVVAHSPAMVKDLDRIVLLWDGTVKAQGSHQELLASCEEYRRLFGGIGE